MIEPNFYFIEFSSVKKLLKFSAILILVEKYK